MKALLLALALLAQPTDSLPDLSHPWSLKECTQWALEHNLTVVGQKLQAENRNVERNTAEMSWLPSLNGQVSENMSFGRGLGGNNTYEYGNSATTGFSVGSSMTLFDGLATPNRIKLARINLDAATEDLEKARDDIRVAVAKAYVQVLYNLEIEDVARHQVSIDSLQVERLSGMMGVGKSSKAQLSQQKASLAQSKVTLVQAQNNVRAAVLDLAQLLELPSWDGFSIVRITPDAPSNIVLGHPDDIYADAVMDRPSIKAEELRLQGTERSIEIAKSGYYPSLSLSAGLGTNYYSTFWTAGFWDQLGANFAQYVGLSLNIPIFNKFQVRNQVRSAKIQQEAQKTQLRRVQQSLYKEIYQAWNGAVAAQAKYDASIEASAAAQDAFSLVEARYEAGAATITEFSDARNRMMKAQSDLVQASCEYLFQTALVGFYRTGTLEL